MYQMQKVGSLHLLIFLWQGHVLNCTSKSKHSKMFVYNSVLNSQYLQEIYDDDLSIVQIIFESFLEDSIITWNEILTEIESKNFQVVGEKVHQIKPSFSMVGLTFLHPKIQAFELYAKSVVDERQLLKLYNELDDEISDAKLVIEDELKRIKELV